MADHMKIQVELSYIELIHSFRGGALAQDANTKLHELLTAMQETGGNGKITTSVALKMNKAGQIEAVAEVKINKPTRPLGTGIFFLTEDSGLTRRDPRQYDIEDEIARRRSGD